MRNCSGGSLKNVPKFGQLDINFRILDLKNNSITELCIVHPYMKNIDVLILQFNRITSVCLEFLASNEMSSHKGLLIDIRNNMLTQLPEQSMELKTVQWKLSGNLFLCNCDTLWMRDWFDNTVYTYRKVVSSRYHTLLQKQRKQMEIISTIGTCLKSQSNASIEMEKVEMANKWLDTLTKEIAVIESNVVIDYEDVICNGGEFDEHPIYQLQADKLGCLSYLITREAVISLAFILSFGVIIVCLIMVAFRRWNEIRWIIYRKTNRFIRRGDKCDDLDNYVFDAFISYR